MQPFNLCKGQVHTPDAIPWGYGDRIRSLDVLPLVPPMGSARRPRPSLHRPLRGEFTGFFGTMTRCDSLPPFRRASLPSLGDTRRCVGTFAPSGPEHSTAGRGFVSRSPLPATVARRWSGPFKELRLPHHLRLRHLALDRASVCCLWARIIRADSGCACSLSC